MTFDQKFDFFLTFTRAIKENILMKKKLNAFPRLCETLPFKPENSPKFKSWIMRHYSFKIIDFSKNKILQLTVKLSFFLI